VHRILHLAVGAATFPAMPSDAAWLVDGPATWRPTPGLWFEARRTDRPGLLLRFRLSGRTDEGPLRLTAVCVERDDREVAARDLRSFHLRDLVAMATEGWNIDTGERTPKPSRPGPAGHPEEHWRRVWQLYEEARSAGARSYIGWMRSHWTPPVPDATMRRWLRVARERYEGGDQR
jgi:hypothetical protein